MKNITMSKWTSEHPLRVFEAFAGYGSQHLALNEIKKQIPDFDFKVVGVSEIDKFAIQAYGAVHGDCPNYGDISQINWDDVPDFDFFTYSSPCQDFSNAGLQKGGEEGSGTRSSLLWECRRAIEAKRPKYLMLENVKALVGKKFLPLFHKWIETLEDYGYTNYYAVLNAKDYGIPQNRERVFCISIHGDHDIFHFPASIPLELRLKDILEEEVDDKYVLSETAIQGFLKHNENHKAKGTGFLWIPKDVETTGGGRLLIASRQGSSSAEQPTTTSKNLGGGNPSLTASEELVLSAQRTIPLEKSDVANCLRARASLNATDNTIVEHAKESDSSQPNA